jgi:hypothetical protein
LLRLQERPNTRRQGDIGVALAIKWFIENGYRPFVPIGELPDYDLVVDFDGVLYRVQVRTTYFKKPSGNYEVNLRVLGGNRSGTGKIKHFDPQKVDYLFVVTESGEKYFIPSHAILIKSALTLCEKYAVYQVE